jgi:hypothetical protein
MSNLFRRSLLILFSTAALLMFAAAASAQDCDSCDPYSSHCNDYCDRCTHYGVDGCTSWSATTCGDDRVLGGNCLANGCTPNFQETARTTQGTYGNGEAASCTHHKVDWVTLTDQNGCNLNSYWWVNHACEDSIDGSKSGIFPDCCDGYGQSGLPDSLFTCNGYHSCTG